MAGQSELVSGRGRRVHGTPPICSAGSPGQRRRPPPRGGDPPVPVDSGRRPRRSVSPPKLRRRHGSRGDPTLAVGAPLPVLMMHQQHQPHHQQREPHHQQREPHRQQHPPHREGEEEEEEFHDASLAPLVLPEGIDFVDSREYHYVLEVIAQKEQEIGGLNQRLAHVEMQTIQVQIEQQQRQDAIQEELVPIQVQIEQQQQQQPVVNDPGLEIQQIEENQRIVVLLRRFIVWVVLYLSVWLLVHQCTGKDDWARHDKLDPKFVHFTRYIIVVILTTVGYGDVYPISTRSRIFTAIILVVFQPQVNFWGTQFLEGLGGRLLHMVKSVRVKRWLEIICPILITIFLVVLGGFLFRAYVSEDEEAAGKNIFRYIYESLISACTVGFGDYQIQTHAGREVVIWWLPATSMIYSMTMSYVAKQLATNFEWLLCYVGSLLWNVLIDRVALLRRV